VTPLITQRFDAMGRSHRPAACAPAGGAWQRRPPDPAFELGTHAVRTLPREPKRFVLVDGGTHHNTNSVGQAQYPRRPWRGCFRLPTSTRVALTADSQFFSKLSFHSHCFAEGLDRPKVWASSFFPRTQMETIGTWWMWTALAVFVVVAIAIDLLVMERQGAHKVTIKEAVHWSLLWFRWPLCLWRSCGGTWTAARAARWPIRCRCSSSPAIWWKRACRLTTSLSF
jgi:hypothetical protein